MTTAALLTAQPYESLRIRKQFLLVFLGTWLIYLAFLPPGIQSIDGGSMLEVAHSIVTKHNVTVASGDVGRDGRSFSRWYPLQSLFAVPVVWFAVKASIVFHLPVHYVESFAATLLPALYTALTVALVYVLAVFLGAEELGAWLAAVVYGFGTIALVYTRDFYADPLLALLVVLGFLLVFRTQPSWLVLPITLLAVLAKPSGIVLGPVLSVYLFWRTRRFWLSLLPGLGTAIGLGLYSLYNFYRFESFTRFGQLYLFSPKYVPAGLIGLLISPGSGLIWFCPCVVLSVVALTQMKTRKLEAWAIVGFAICFFFLHCLWVEWHGGSSWGPRLLLPILPGLIALTGVLNRVGQRVLAVLAILTFLFTAANLPSSYKRYVSELGERGLFERELLWQPALSPILNAWPAALRQINDARQCDVRTIYAQHSDVPAATIATSRALRVVSLWWWVLPVVHISRFWGILLSVLLVITGILLLQLARSRARIKEHAAGMTRDLYPRPIETSQA